MQCILLAIEDSVKMAVASEDESKQMTVTSSDTVKTDDSQGQAPVSSVSGGSYVDENPFLVWFLKEATEIAKEAIQLIFVCLFLERHISIQTSLEGLEMLVDLNGGKDDFRLIMKYWK